MSDISNRVNELISTFVAEVTRLARGAAVETLSRALGGGGAAAPTVRRRITPTPRIVRTKGAKRPKGEIAELQQRVLAHVKENPGQRIEQINKVLGTTTSDLTLPLRKLIAAGDVSTKGTRRATKYFPGEGEPRAKRRRR